MNSLVSVIIPVYNVEQYIDRCLETIVSQTYTNLEIILVDDGSMDSCPQKCDEWAKKDNRIKVTHKKNAGVGCARNTGLDIALGDYITFVDPDDYLSIDAIETMIKRITDDQSDLVIAQFMKVYSDSPPRLSAYTWMHDTVISKDEAMGMIGSKKQPIPVYLWSKLYRKQVFSGIRFNSLNCGEDVYILPHVIDQCKKISLTDDVVYFYFQRDTSIVHSKTKSQVLDSMSASLHVARFLLEHDFVEGACRFYYSVVIQSFQIKGDKDAERLVKDAFDSKERRLLKKGRDLSIIVSVLASKFPGVYGFLESVKKRLTMRAITKRNDANK